MNHKDIKDMIPNKMDDEMLCAFMCMAVYLLDDQGDHPQSVVERIGEIRTKFSRKMVKRVIRRLRAAQAQYRMENRLENVVADFEATIDFARRRILNREEVWA